VELCETSSDLCETIIYTELKGGFTEVRGGGFMKSVHIINMPIISLYSEFLFRSPIWIKLLDLTPNVSNVV
jgi:hypothetical protein